MNCRSLFLPVFALCVLFATACASVPKGVEPVQSFDQQKYLGKWYEIARFDYTFERNLDNVTATYSLRNDGKIRVENRGYNTVKGIWETAEGKAKLAGDPGEAELKVSFLGPFYAGYNVIAIDNDYKYALVAGKNRDFLWLLSREKTIPEEVRLAYLKKADELGFETEKLIWVNHTPE